MILVKLLMKFFVVIDGIIIHREPPRANHRAFHLREYFQQKFTISKCHLLYVGADSKLRLTLWLDAKGILQTQISPRFIQLCLLLLIGGSPAATSPVYGRHHLHHRPWIILNCFLLVRSDLTLAAIRVRFCQNISRIKGCDIAYMISRDEIGKCSISRKGSKIHEAQNILIL